jgi:hypothetical protein
LNEKRIPQIETVLLNLFRNVKGALRYIARGFVDAQAAIYQRPISGSLARFSPFTIIIGLFGYCFFR